MDLLGEPPRAGGHYVVVEASVFNDISAGVKGAGQLSVVCL